MYICVTPVQLVSWASSNCWWISDKCKYEITQEVKTPAHIVFTDERAAPCEWGSNTCECERETVQSCEDKSRDVISKQKPALRETGFSPLGFEAEPLFHTFGTHWLRQEVERSVLFAWQSVKWIQQEEIFAALDNIQGKRKRHSSQPRWSSSFLSSLQAVHREQTWTKHQNEHAWPFSFRPLKLSQQWSGGSSPLTGVPVDYE